MRIDFGSVFGIFAVGCMLFFFSKHVDEKIEKMQSLWQSANQAVVQNQKKEIDVNIAFSHSKEQLRDAVMSMNETDKKEWREKYTSDIQKILHTPPDGISEQNYV